MGKFVVGLDEKLAPTDVEEGMRVGTQRAGEIGSKLQIKLPLPPKIDPTVTMMTVEEKPDVTYSDLGGCKDQIDKIREVVEMPLLHPEKFTQLGIDPPKGVLLYGPPGTGKTLTARAVANRTDACFIRVIGSELVQRYVGEGARMVRELFQMARSKKSCIIFFDEVDAVGGARFGEGDSEVQRTMLEIVNQLDGFDSRGNVKVLMATNRPDTLDPALARPGRIDRKTTTHLHAAKKITAREKPKVSSKPLSSYLQDTDNDHTNDNHISNNENDNINQQIEINIENTDNSNTIDNNNDIDYDQHHNYPKVILQADKLGRSVQSQLLRILPNNQEQKLVSTTPEWKKLQRHATETIKSLHLRDMLQDTERCNSMYATHDGVYYDYSRQQATLETMELLFDLATKQNLQSKIKDMFNGKKINFTENRAVLHTALRASKQDIGTVFVDELDAIKEVHDVLDQIKTFTEAFRSGKITGYTGKRMRNIVSVGIGGSYLGPEFLHEVLKTEAEGINSSLGYSLRFLANVDPVDVERTCADLDPEETLIIVVSKTFTTAETMLNARTMRQWLWDFMGDDIEVVKRHVVACSSVSATENVKEFGIDTDKYFFRFWDWVGGRYSVCGAAGAVPISLLYGFDLFEKFLDGARSMDQHFLNAPMKENIPIIMGLLGVWNVSNCCCLCLCSFCGLESHLERLPSSTSVLIHGV